MGRFLSHEEVHWDCKPEFFCKGLGSFVIDGGTKFAEGARLAVPLVHGAEREALLPANLTLIFISHCIF